jgi:SAM-dependent methyltransferase
MRLRNQKRGRVASGRDRSSFRDNRGYIFWQDGTAYRRINADGKVAYDQLLASGLYDQLTSEGRMVAHEEVSLDSPHAVGAYKIIRPTQIPFISYPYEWSFSQLKDAALATLSLQQAALRHGLVLRDASAYNIQFVDGRPQLIDTLSFDVYVNGEPWVAYRQFCQHFLAPLALMSHVHPDLLQLLRVHIDGIPLHIAARTLPARARINFGLYTHISLHASFQKRHESAERRPTAAVSTMSLQGVLDNLERTIGGLKLRVSKTQWGDYYDNTNYSDASFKQKSEITESYLREIKPGRVLDLGANDGSFSRIAARLGAAVLSADIDPLAVEANYLQVKAQSETQLLPLLIDLTNPSPDLGWANQERHSFTERAQADAALALALIHHLAIANNLPLEMVAEYFARLAPNLIIEFVPKQDSQVKRLLATREDIFPDYNPAGFEQAFGRHFRIVEQRPVQGSERIMYLMERLP